MKKLELASLSVDELWALHEEVAQLLSARIMQEKQQLEQRLEQLNQTYQVGSSVHELRGRRSGADGRRFYPKVYPKYQNPLTPEETWSGRGKQPKWLTRALAAGKKIEDFRIAKNDDSRALKRVSTGI